MWLIPAIDLKNGKCVRLRQGRMEDATVFADDPVAVADMWVEQGAERLHLVDLDGAFAGEPRNAEVVRSIARTYPDLLLQVGGGIRTLSTLGAYLEAGVDFAIIGTQAVRSPEFVSQACSAFPEHIIVGLDAKQGKVAIEGWSQGSNIQVIDLARRFEGVGVQAIVYTDIERDGMLQGVNVEATAELARAVSIPVIASGGVTNDHDVKRLLAYEDDGIAGIILGRALYEGTLNLPKALELCAHGLG